jgi:hypothetical protein
LALATVFREFSLESVGNRGEIVPDFGLDVVSVRAA